MFQCWKANQGLKLSRNSWTPENAHLHICSLWFLSVEPSELFTWYRSNKPGPPPGVSPEGTDFHFCGLVFNVLQYWAPRPSDHVGALQFMYGCVIYVRDCSTNDHWSVCLSEVQWGRDSGTVAALGLLKVEKQVKCDKVDSCPSCHCLFYSKTHKPSSGFLEEKDKMNKEISYLRKWPPRDTRINPNETVVGGGEKSGAGNAKLSKELTVLLWLFLRINSCVTDSGRGCRALLWRRSPLLAYSAHSFEVLYFLIWSYHFTLLFFAIFWSPTRMLILDSGQPWKL